MCAATDYAVVQGAFTSDDNIVDGKAACRWWLRSPGDSLNEAAYVSSDGSLFYDFMSSVQWNDNEVHEKDSVRPVMWISIN